MSGYSNGDSLDFNNLEGPDLNSATRQFFRVSIGDNKNYFVKIGEKNYSLVDVSATGISFFANSGKEFPIGTVVSGCKLKFDKDSINNLNGKIVHNSSEPVNGEHDIEKRWLCGMLWENIDSTKEKLLLSGFEDLKKAVLANKTSDADE